MENILSIFQESRSQFRSRAGFSQCDGIAQYSGKFYWHPDKTPDERDHDFNDWSFNIAEPKLQTTTDLNHYSRLFPEESTQSPEIPIKRSNRRSHLSNRSLYSSSAPPSTFFSGGLYGDGAARVRRKLDEARLVAALRAAAETGPMVPGGGFQLLEPPPSLNQPRRRAQIVRRQHAFGRTVYEDEDEEEEGSSWQKQQQRGRRKKQQQSTWTNYAAVRRQRSAPITMSLPRTSTGSSSASLRRGLTGNTALDKVFI